MKYKRLQIIFFVVSVFFHLQISAQDKKIIDYRSSILYTTAELGPDIKVLTDSVAFFHEGAEMYCDSALFNPSENYFKAFFRIEIIKPRETDTVYMYGDSLHYSGITKIAKMRGNVILVQDSVTLSTDSLDFNLNTNIGYYPRYGVTVSGEDTLESKEGFYYADTKELFFKDSVVVKNTRFRLYSDTLKHNTRTKISYIFGPTDIISDSNYIYCEKGKYNHDTDKAFITKNSFLKNEAKTMWGDSLYYDRQKAYGEAFRNVMITDTVQNLLLTGHYGKYDEARDISLITRQALFTQINAPGDSLFMHADTLIAKNDTLKIPDIDDKGIDIQRDSVYRVIRAYKHVKIFKEDFQAKCDSLTYSFSDSVMQMFKKPVVWSAENQLSAEKITVYTEKSKVVQLDLEENAFAISQDDSIRFNQVKGKIMIGYLENDELYRVDVKDEGQSLYYVRDDDQLLIGVNVIECKDMIIYLENQKIDKIWFYTNPKGRMHPPMTLTDEMRYLSDFKWYDYLRPLSKADVFEWREEPESKKK